MESNELRDILNGYFGWNKARMSCFVGMLLALFKVRTINLTELACGFLSNAYPFGEIHLPTSSQLIQATSSLVFWS